MAKRTVLYYKQDVVVVYYCRSSLHDCIRLKDFLFVLFKIFCVKEQSVRLHKIEIVDAMKMGNRTHSLRGYTIKNVAARAAAWRRTSTNCGRGSFSLICKIMYKM